MVRVSLLDRARVTSCPGFWGRKSVLGLSALKPGWPQGRKELLMVLGVGSGLEGRSAGSGPDVGLARLSAPQKCPQDLVYSCGPLAAPLSQRRSLPDGALLSPDRGPLSHGKARAGPHPRMEQGVGSEMLAGGPWKGCLGDLLSAQGLWLVGKESKL